jgi:hypothetical protein
MLAPRTMLVLSIAIVSVLLYKQYQRSETDFDAREQYRFAQEYFIGDDNIHARKPYLWIHAQGELNARSWESFGSRSSTKLNQPYLYFTIKSIADRCKESFNVFLIDDASFAKLVPGWSVKMDLLPSPLKERYRQFGLTSLLYEFGGVTVPASTLCLHDMQSLFKASLQKSDAFTVETAVDHPDPKFMGSAKKGDGIKKFRDMQGALLKKDLTAETDFMRTLATWCKANTHVVCGRNVGARKVCGSPVDLSELLGKNEVAFADFMCCLYLPADEILKRPKYAWFARMAVDQITMSDLMIAKYTL